MLSRLIYCFLAASLIVPLSAQAQMKAKPGSGRYATHTISEDMVELPNDVTLVTQHYHQVVFADQSDHMLNNTTGNCVGLIRVSQDGSPLSSSGFCDNTDASGNGHSFWWRLDESNTATCADICGTWGFVDGYGKYKGVTGTGTWSRTTVFPDGTTGTWTLK